MFVGAACPLRQASRNALRIHVGIPSCLDAFNRILRIEPPPPEKCYARSKARSLFLIAGGGSLPLPQYW
jgi:hypothetical protein